ncbi:MAG: hypothetical protein IPL26_01145 [Leptospiraceae bacterium]|nr:hypothetical protein [Leptospiraceae bacterium]
MTNPTPLQIRKELLSLVRKDLFGSANGHEEEGARVVRPAVLLLTII